ncbi:hypothetical protein FACS1894199_00240 [Bacteroidia bacterium]|nr:hypothetical protein FACS1894199_00240 [Bacteroidia bacterium]
MRKVFIGSVFISKVFIGIIFLYVCSTGDSFAQIATKRDYDIAIAAHLGGNAIYEVSPVGNDFLVRPIGGLKFTMPFNRTWFFGYEVNYNINDLSVPLYLKRSLKNKDNCIVFGAYASYRIKENENTNVSSDNVSNGGATSLGAGVLIGFEHKITYDLHIAFKISGGLVEQGEQLKIPLQATISLSYDIHRSGGCGCH